MCLNCTEVLNFFSFCIFRNIRTLTEPPSKASDEVFKTAEDNTSNSFSLAKQDSIETQSVSSGKRDSIIGSKHIPTKTDGTPDYDGKLVINFHKNAKR